LAGERERKREGEREREREREREIDKERERERERERRGGGMGGDKPISIRARVVTQHKHCTQSCNWYTDTPGGPAGGPV